MKLTQKEREEWASRPKVFELTPPKQYTLMRRGVEKIKEAGRIPKYIPKSKVRHPLLRSGVKYINYASRIGKWRVIYPYRDKEGKRKVKQLGMFIELQDAIDRLNEHKMEISNKPQLK